LVLSYRGMFLSLRQNSRKWRLSKVASGDGRVLWATDLGDLRNVMLLSSSARTVFILTDENTSVFGMPNKLVAVEKQTGRVLWRQAVPQRGWSLHAREGRLIYWESKGRKLVGRLADRG